VGLTPFGLAVGAAAAASSDPLAAWAGTLLIFSGSGQATLLQALHGGAPVWSAILVAALVNARIVVYSASLAPMWARTPLRWKLLGAATIVEPTWAVAEQRRRDGTEADGALAHYAGAAAAVALLWLTAVTAGVLAGRPAGAADHLAVAVPLCLAVLVVPHLRLPGGAVAVAAAAAAAAGARAVLPGSEVLVAMAAAAGAGLLAQRGRAA
jgi:predicted branched-subunit amino acid permease